MRFCLIFSISNQNRESRVSHVPQGFLGHITVAGHVPIELSRYIFFAGQHGCSFVVKVEQSKPVVSPLVQGGLEIVCNVTAIWTSRPGLNKLRMFVEEHYSDIRWTKMTSVILKQF